MSSENPFLKSTVPPRKTDTAGLVEDVFGKGAGEVARHGFTKARKEKKVVLEKVLEDASLDAEEVALGKELEKEILQPGEVRLSNIPAFSILPSEDTLKRDFKLDEIWKEEYREDQSWQRATSNVM